MGGLHLSDLNYIVTTLYLCTCSLQMKKDCMPTTYSFMFRIMIVVPSTSLIVNIVATVQYILAECELNGGFELLPFTNRAPDGRKSSGTYIYMWRVDATVVRYSPSRPCLQGKHCHAGRRDPTSSTRLFGRRRRLLRDDDACCGSSQMMTRTWPQQLYTYTRTGKTSVPNLVCLLRRKTNTESSFQVVQLVVRSLKLTDQGHQEQRLALSSLQLAGYSLLSVYCTCELKPVQIVDQIRVVVHFS
jgi:hypothetical protein